jgi:hypothetical protein
MKYDCELIRDLLPLYNDNVASAASRAAVDEHLVECEACRDFKKKMETSVSKQAASETEDAETIAFARLAKRLRRRKIINACIIVVVILVLFFGYSYGTGKRFDSYSCAQNSYFINEDSVLLGEVDMFPFHIYLYENDDKYQTIGTQYSFPFWSSICNFGINKTDDLVKLVGWHSQTYGEDSIMVVAVQCFDENVAYIEMGKETDRQRKIVTTGEVIIFSWDYTMTSGELNGVAYSEDGKSLYRLGYDMTDNIINIGDLGWLPIDDE